MKLHSIIYIVICLLLFFFESKSQSINTLLKTAEENNLELQALHNEYLASLEKAPQISFPDPVMNLGVFPLPVETRLGTQRVRLSATQMLPWFGVLDRKKELENAKAKALFERIGGKVLDLFYKIKKAYYTLYEIEQRQGIMRRNITILESLNKIVLNKVAVGKATTADALQIQLKIEELKQSLQILETTKTNPVTDINHLLSRSLDTPVTIVDSLSLAVILFDKDTFIANIQNNHPMLRMLVLQQDIAEQAISLNDLNTKPSFGAGVDYIVVNQRDDANPTSNGRDILQLRASIKIPLYKQKYQAKEREEKLKITALNNKKAHLLSKFEAMIEKAYAKYETARLKTELYEKQSKITKTAIDILLTKYSTDASGFNELLQLEKERVDYDLKILDAIMESHVAKISIEKFIGWNTDLTDFDR